MTDSTPKAADEKVYLAGPVEQSDDPRSWRDELKANFPSINFVDPMDWQKLWEEKPEKAIQRMLKTVERHPVLACKIGSEAPRTVGTHHEISHALAHGNERVAVVPTGEVAGFIAYRVPTYPSANEALEALLSEPLAVRGGRQ